MNGNQPQKGDILIVDDTLENLRLLSTMLEQEGYDVRSVRSGKVALMGIRAQPPDLILLDINMPEMNGFEVCRQLKANSDTAAIPIIFISALNEVFDKVTAFELGGRDYISKPFQVAEVIVRIENQLEIARLQAQLHRALEQEKALNQRIEEIAALEERHRIARDIHDSLGHALVALNIQLETAITLWKLDSEQALTLLKEAKAMGSEALKAVRESVTDLRGDPLQGRLLERAIATLTQEVYHTTGIQSECQINLSHSLSHQVNTAVYRIIQEGLTNIIKHAQATKVSLKLQSEDTGLYLLLQDNGKGFHPNSNLAGFGLRGMKERAASLGGKLEINSQLGQGCQIQGFFPYKRL